MGSWVYFNIILESLIKISSLFIVQIYFDSFEIAIRQLYVLALSWEVFWPPPQKSHGGIEYFD